MAGFDSNEGAPVVFDDWMRQEARRLEVLIGLTSLFYPMAHIERMELDETIGPLVCYANRFANEVGRTVDEAARGRDEDE